MALQRWQGTVIFYSACLLSFLVGELLGQPIVVVLSPAIGVVCWLSFVVFGGTRKPEGQSERDSGASYGNAARRLGLISAALAITADQVSQYVVAQCTICGWSLEGATTKILPFLEIGISSRSIDVTRTTLIDGQNLSYLLMFVELALFFLLALWLWQTRNALLAIGAGLMIGSGLSNLAEYFLNSGGHSIFLFHTSRLGSFDFNFADIAVWSGVIVLGIGALRRSQERSGLSNRG